MSHYDTLGVKASASQDEIRLAYFKLAKQHHPDVGGNSDTMARISLAYEILGDEQKRALYDATGVENPDAGDPIFTMALEVISSAFKHAVQQVRPASSDLRTDMRRMISDKLKVAERALEEKRHQLAAKEVNVKAAQGRFKLNDGAEGNNLLEGIVRGHLDMIAQARARIDEEEKQTEPHRRALKILEDYSYEFDRQMMDHGAVYQQRLGVTGFFGTTTGQP